MKKKAIGTYYCTITVDIFKTAVLVLVANTMEDVLEDLPKIYKDINPDIDFANDLKEIEKIYEEDGYMSPGHTIQLPNDAGDVIIIFKETNISKVSEELIVYETYHASHYICDYRGVKDEETEAYVQEHLFNQMMCKIDEWNDNHKKKK
jgi:hypothetical protein